MKLHRAIGAVAGLLLASVAWSFGSEGHMAVGNLADKLIEGTAAADQVKAILGPDETLKQASIWPDCARGVTKKNGQFVYAPDPKYHDKHCAVFETPAGQQEMIDYVTRNWDNCEYSGAASNCHKAFHFADIPLQLGHYSETSVGAGNQDIVHAIRACVVFLRDGTTVEPFHFGQGAPGRKEALRLLAHLVGDIHQPLHVGATYLTPNGRATNPNATKKFSPLSETRGGNLLLAGSSNLHTQWDDVKSGLGGEDLTGDAAAVLATDGEIETWSTTWATETVHQARIAYTGMSYAKHVDGKGWPVTFKDRASYLKSERDMQREQVTKAGARLAELLQALWKD